MHITLATVTERTRQIGIGRTRGARRQDIINQFLTETLVLTGSGGLLGVAFGLMCGPIFCSVRSLLNSINPDLLPSIIHSIEPRFALGSVIRSLFISLGVGLLFGV